MLDLQPRNLLYIRELPQQRQEVAVNRTELAERVAAKAGLDRRQSEAAVEAVTESIVAELKSGEKVTLFGFGTFEAKAVAARTARNPQTQAIVKVPAHKAARFRPATAFKDALNTRGKATGTKKAAPAKKAASASKAAVKKAAVKKAAVKKAPAKKLAVAKKAAPAKATRATKKR
jgi:DNA-binding protein HU-beta